MASTLLASVLSFLCKCLIFVLSFGPMPKHVAVITDGNRRFAKRRNLKGGAGHRAGYENLVSILQFCFVIGLKYITVYAFSIDNFKRKPEEVESLMSLMEEKIYEILKEDSIVMKNHVKLNFWGNLNLLSEPARLAAEKAMAITANNTGMVVSVCVAYTSSSEIMHAIGEVCVEKKHRIQEGQDVDGLISVADLEHHLYTAGCPDPDVVIRTSGETRLSNFLLWQTTSSHLQILEALWPEFSPLHFVWAILEYQKAYPYLKEIRDIRKKRE